MGAAQDCCMQIFARTMHCTESGKVRTRSEYAVDTEVPTSGAWRKARCQTYSHLTREMPAHVKSTFRFPMLYVWMAPRWAIKAMKEELDEELERQRSPRQPGAIRECVQRRNDSWHFLKS